MPRQVDHDERRREIIKALWSLAGREGLSAVTFRNVAAEANVSVRRIQYYFGDKAGLLKAALQQLGERGFARGLEAIADAGPEATVRQVLASLFRTGLPLDEQSRQIGLLFYSFHVAAITDADLGTVEAREVKRWTVPFAAALIGQAQDEGGTRPGVEPGSEALILMSAFDGLSLDLLAGNRTDEEALSAIDYHLDRIFNGKPVAAVMPDPASLGPHGTNRL
ncbi:MAG: TetR/AcrR family transcriptional regulator [Acidimicrobiales bacterium]